MQDSRFDADRGDVITRALESLEGFVVIGDSIPNSERAVASCRDRLYAAVGIHPYHALDVDTQAIDALRRMTALAGVKAIGEIGLDYYNEFSPRPAQRTAFLRQLELATECALPIVIHNRQADEDTLDILKDFLNTLPGGIMHCFGSDAPFAVRCVDLGLYVSFAGNVTFPKAEPLRDAARAVPIERLLIETDAPYLAPVPLRGKRCEPAFLRHTAASIAALKNVSLDELAHHTTQNARRVYRLAPI